MSIVKSKTKKNLSTPIEFEISDPIYSFDDLILADVIVSDIKKAVALVEYRNKIYEEWGLNRVIKQPRNVSLNLYGASGTGKTMAAHAIAKYLSKKLLLVNYAEIESKYVGETAKNLIKLFEYAEANDVVIVFDEADALLSKRVTSMHNATDVSVNQTRNVLLKILDVYDGVVIFTTNFIRNYDKAFMRRITSHIKLDAPNKELREKLWLHYMVSPLPIYGNRSTIAKDLSDIEDLTGADISTVVLKAAIAAAVDNKKEISVDMIKNEIEHVLVAKKAIDDINSEYQITTRKVSAEYVKEQSETGGIIRDESIG